MKTKKNNSDIHRTGFGVGVFALFLFSFSSYAQNISINTTGAANSTNSMLEVIQPSTTNGTSGLFIRHNGVVTGTGYSLWAEKTGASTTNIAGYFTASGATNNYGLIVNGGNVGIGTINPISLFSVGASSQFQVDASGDPVKVNNVIYTWPGSQGANGSVLKNDGSGNLTWATTNYAGEYSKVFFWYTGTVQKFTVPPGITTIYIKMWAGGGGYGGYGYYSQGGSGGYVTATISNAGLPGTTFNVIVGGGGGESSGYVGSFGGGAAGGPTSQVTYPVGIGGDYSALQTTGGTYFLIAGGGGGGCGGYYESSSPSAYANGYGGGGAGGAATFTGAASTGGFSGNTTVVYAGVGGSTVGGTGGTGVYNGTAGVSMQGGSGGGYTGATSIKYTYGGGGGGGYFGGGGGAGYNNALGASTAYGGGGGGGSNYYSSTGVFTFTTEASYAGTNGANSGSGTCPLPANYTDSDWGGNSAVPYGPGCGGGLNAVATIIYPGADGEIVISW